MRRFPALTIVMVALFLLQGVAISCSGSMLIAQMETGTAASLLTPAQLEQLLPATVFFQGRTAPVQLRNAGGVRLNHGGVFFAALVDTAGYSSNIQDQYQFYLVTEEAVRFAGQTLQPGAYGAGFQQGRFIVMDIGGHPILQGTTVMDQALKRPRPLQLVAGAANEVKLYLGRRYVVVSIEPSPK